MTFNCTRAVIRFVVCYQTFNAVDFQTKHNKKYSPNVNILCLSCSHIIEYLLLNISMFTSSTYKHRVQLQRTCIRNYKLTL